MCGACLFEKRLQSARFLEKDVLGRGEMVC